MQGTLDNTAFLAVPAAVAFVQSMGGLASIIDRNHRLVAWAANMLVERWGTELLVPLDRCTSMAVVRCPFDPSRRTPCRELEGGGPVDDKEPEEEDLFAMIWDRFDIICPVIRMPGAPGVWARISAQIYNCQSDYTRLADAVLAIQAERQAD